MAPKTRITRTEQGEQEQGRARTTSQAPPLPSIPAPVPRQLGGGQDGQEAGDPVDEHRHPQVRLFDRAARPIITPHARLPYSMPRGVVPR
jgi:hypothetical protein